MNTTFHASVIVLVTGVFWGIYWVPVRAIADLGLDGAWGTGAITLAAMLFLLPFVAGKTHVFRDTGFVGVVSIALGGAAFALCSIGFLYGKVALVVLLWFFSPVWSVLIAKIHPALECSPVAAGGNRCWACWTIHHAGWGRWSAGAAQFG